MSALLLAERFEGQVLQTSDFGLEETQVHERRAVVVVTLDLLHAAAGDPEESQPAAVHAADLDPRQLTAAREPEGCEKEVLGL
jgi:hypothetical protein